MILDLAMSAHSFLVEKVAQIALSITYLAHQHELDFIFSLEVEKRSNILSPIFSSWGVGGGWGSPEHYIIPKRRHKEYYFAEDCVTGENLSSLWSNAECFYCQYVCIICWYTHALSTWQPENAATLVWQQS